MEDGGSGSQAARSSRRATWAVLALALAVRALALWVTRDVEPVRDEVLYLDRGRALLEGQGFLGSYQSWVLHEAGPRAELPQYPGAFQPPLYTLFVAAMLALSGGSVLAVKLAQVLLGTFSTWVALRLGKSWFDERRGLLAATVFALYPTLVFFTHTLWTETLFIALLLPGIALVSGRAPPSPRAALGAGALLGLAALTRASLLWFLVPLAAWMVLAGRAEARRAIARAALVLAGAALVIAPWTIRNAFVHGGLVPIDSNGPFNLWRGNATQTFVQRQGARAGNYSPPFESLPIAPVGNVQAPALIGLTRERLGVEHPSDLEVMRCARELAWETIRGDPAAFLRRGRLKTIDMWNPTSFLVRHFEIGAYRGPPAVRQALTWTSVLGYLAVVALALVGAWLARRDARTWLVLLLVAYYASIHALTFGLTRFRLPLMPFLILLAAHGALALVDLGRGRRASA